MFNHLFKPPCSPWRIITALLLIANFIFGVTICAVLPVFEGADETAHFSRLQAQAFPLKSAEINTPQGKKDNLNARLSAAVIDYYTHGPMPYQWVDRAPTEKDGKALHYFTYGSFFDQPSPGENYVAAYREAPLPAGFESTSDANWQYQHPPLFYLMLGQAMKHLAGHASLVTIMFTLRVLCYAMAFAGFAIGLYGTRTHLRHLGVTAADTVTTLGAFYPFLIPEFAWEFARLGNDSMCLLLFGIIWSLFLCHMRAPRGDAWLYLGFTLGLSLLVKALMIPVAATIIIALGVFHIRQRRKDSSMTGRWWTAPLKVGALTLFLSLPIYLLNYLHGNVGAVNFQHVLDNGNGWNLLLQNFAWYDLFHNMLGMVQTAVWLFGTWSLIIIDLPIHRALIIFSLVILVVYLRVLRRGTDGFFYALPLWLIAVFFASLLSNVLVATILQNKDATPGYYVHILAPAFALIYGTALTAALRHGWSKALMAVFGLAIVLFDFFILWAHAAAFAGCAVPTNADGIYLLHPADILLCTRSFPVVLDRLGILAWPNVAVCGAAFTFILLIKAGVMALRAPISVKTS